MHRLTWGWAFTTQTLLAFLRQPRLEIALNMEPLAPPFTVAGLFFMRNRSLFIRGVLLRLYLLLLHDWLAFINRGRDCRALFLCQLENPISRIKLHGSAARLGSE